MYSKKIQRLAVAAGAASAALAVSTGVAATASAQPNGPASKPGHCAIENTDSNGNTTVEYVPTGTRIGLMYCGSDGEWHLGWLVDAAVSPTGGGAKPPTKAPVNVGAANGGVLTATR